jgi:AcrR family transcriptional regulator
MPKPPARQGYHHGSLRESLIAAAVQLIETNGLDQVSVRDVAKAAGVSPGAPFRHFPNRTALLTAVAEQAMDRLKAQIDRSLLEAADQTPLLRYRAIGTAFLAWAFRNPVHFQVISTRAVIDFEGSSIQERHAEIRSTMSYLMQQASAAGELRGEDSSRYAVMGRALSYGLARMYVDGQFPSWGLDADAPLNSAVALVDDFIDAISATGSARSPRPRKPK